MQLIFLGTGAGAPSRNRNVSSLALRLNQSSETWLFDCGEGTQQQILKTHVTLHNISRIFITHLHGDHIFGLPGLLCSRSLQSASTKPLTIYGPRGLRSYLSTSMTVSQTTLSYPLDIREMIPLQQGTVFSIFEDDRLEVLSGALLHHIESFGFAIAEKPKVGRFRIDLAKAQGVPEGPIYGQLKRGQDVVLEDGRRLIAKNFVEPDDLGDKVVILGDTRPCPASVTLAQDATILIHEATFSSRDQALANVSAHSTAHEAALIAKEAHVKKLLMTHISARYQTSGQDTQDDLLAEARTIFPETDLVNDFYEIDV